KSLRVLAEFNKRGQPAPAATAETARRGLLQLSNLDDLFHAEQDWSFRVRCVSSCRGARFSGDAGRSAHLLPAPDCPVRRLPPGAFQDGVLDRLAPSDWLRLSPLLRSAFAGSFSWRPRLGLRLRSWTLPTAATPLTTAASGSRRKTSCSSSCAVWALRLTPQPVQYQGNAARPEPVRSLTELRLPVCPSPLDCLLWLATSLRCLTVLHLADPDSRLPRGWRRSSRQAVKRVNDQKWTIYRIGQVEGSLDVNVSLPSGCSCGCGRHLEQLSLPAQQLRKAEASDFIADCRLRQLTLTTVRGGTRLSLRLAEGLGRLSFLDASGTAFDGRQAPPPELKVLDAYIVLRKSYWPSDARGLDSRGPGNLLARCRSLVSLDLTKCPDLARPGSWLPLWPVRERLCRTASTDFRPPGFESVAGGGSSDSPDDEEDSAADEDLSSVCPAPPGIRLV
uniref:F-box and leucine rich repeat protein 12 n=1 Tax=Macrostomum lignano TaxID=282301 RepID=A0A1I8JQP9_9PLAT